MAMILALSRLGRTLSTTTSQGITNRRYPRGLLTLIRNLHNKEPIEVTWEKPQKGWTKLNFDGSLKGKTGGASIGGVFRNHEAEFLLGYAESIKPTTSTVAELAALRRGLELTLENGWGDVWMEGDAKFLLDIVVKGRPVRSLEAQKHMSCINKIIPELNRFVFTHVYREGNRAADRFAQMGHRLDKPRIWRTVPPDEVVEIVLDDAQGRVFLRRR